MQGFDILNFGGLKTSIANPPGNSAKSMSNLVRFRHRGVKEGLPYAYLEQADGYAQKYALPATTQTGNKITNCIITDIKSFYVKEHGGQNVQVAVGTYTKTSRYDVTVTLNRSGIWMRPYWSGAAWVDSWFELTEMEILKADSTGGYSTSTIKCTTTDGFAADYFKNWTLVFPPYGAANQADNYFLITGSADSPTQITYFGANASISRTLANAQLYLVRNFINQEMPASLIGMIIGLFNEIRLTTGNTAVDTLVMGGFRTKTFGWATPDYQMDRLIQDRGFLDCWANAFYHTNLTQVASTKPLTQGKYYLQDTLLLDDGQETALRDPTQQSNPATFSEATAFPLLAGVNVLSIVTDGTYIYVLTSDNLVTKYDSDLKKSGMPLLLNSDNPVSTGTSIMLLYNGILYVAEFANIESINAFTMTSIGVGQIVYNTNFITSLATDGTYLYCGSNENAAANNYINRVLLSALTVTGPFTPSVTTLDVTAIGSITSALYVTNTELYAGIDSKAAYISLAAFTVTGNYALDGPVNQFSPTGNNRYLLAAINLAPGKLDYLDTVLHSATTAITFAAGQNYPIGIVYDGAYQWVAFNTNPILFMKLSADGTTVQYTFTAPAGQTGSAGLILLGSSPIAITTTAQAYIIILNISGFAYQVTTGTTALQFQEMISAGAIPKRAAAIRHYLSTNGVDFYLIKEVSLLAGVGAVSWGAAAIYDASTEHFYHQSGLITINSDDQNAKGALAQVILGRDPSDSGAYQFLVAAVAGNLTFIGNVLINGVSILNQGIVCATGEDTIMNDVFPNDQANVIDLEYADGDQIRAILALGENALFLKRRNSVLVSQNADGSFSRDIADRGHGCVSQRACNVYGETAFYADSYGMRMFNTGSGGKPINDDWILEWQALTETQKEQTVTTIDIINRQWLVSLPASAGGKTYVMDLDTGEWVSLLLADTPMAFADNSPNDASGFIGTIDFLSGTTIMEIGTGTRHNGANFTMSWKSNRIEPLIGADGYLWDTLPEWLAIKYNSSFPISVNIYLDDSATPLNATSYTLAAANTEALIGLPLSARCKGFCLEFIATTTAASQTVQIKYTRVTFDKIPQGGDVLVLSS